jgi:hypothetical protein
MIYSGVGGTDTPHNLFNGVNHSLAELGPSRRTFSAPHSQRLARFSVYLELFDLSRLMDDFLGVYQIIANRSLLSLMHMKKYLLKQPFIC